MDVFVVSYTTNVPPLCRLYGTSRRRHQRCLFLSSLQDETSKRSTLSICLLCRMSRRRRQYYLQVFVFFAGLLFEDANAVYLSLAWSICLFRTSRRKHQHCLFVLGIINLSSLKDLSSKVLKLYVFFTGLLAEDTNTISLCCCRIFIRRGQVFFAGILAKDANTISLSSL